MRDIWVIEGVLAHNFDHSDLLHIAKNYEKIDCVPKGYRYPELYAVASLARKIDIP